MEGVLHSVGFAWTSLLHCLPACLPETPCTALPAGATPFQLRSGLQAFLVQVPARSVHSAKWEAPELQDKGRRLEAAKRQAQQQQQQQQQQGTALVEMQSLAPTEDKKLA